MKNCFMCIIVISVILFPSCQKQLAGEIGTENNTLTDKYITLTANSKWIYQVTNNITPTTAPTTFTITSSTKDTTINNNIYHIFINSNGGNQYLNIRGHDYYQYDSVPLAKAASIERLYLKDDALVNTSWIQNINLNIPNVPIPLPLLITNTIKAKGISKTVNNINYADVIHVQTSISSTLIPAASFTTDINSYYAKKFGLIENTSVIKLNYLGLVQNADIKTILLSADLK